MSGVQMVAWRPGAGLGKLIRAGRLWDSIRVSLGDLADPETLKETLEKLIELGELVGLDPKLVEQFRDLVANDTLRGIVAKVIGFVVRGINRDDDEGGGVQPLGVVEAQSLVAWLPIALEILRIVGKLLAERRGRSGANAVPRIRRAGSDVAPGTHALVIEWARDDCGVLSSDTVAPWDIWTGPLADLFQG